MEESWKIRNERDAENDDSDEGTLLADEPEGSDGADGHVHGTDSRRRNWRSSLWCVLGVMSVLTGRRLLTTGFPYPICFLLLIQAAAYCCVATIVLLIRIKEFRKPKRKCEPGEQYSWQERSVVAARLCLRFPISAAAVICGAEALMLYTNLPVLAMLPIFTYVSDGALLRLASGFGFLRTEKEPSWAGLLRVIVVFGCISVAIFTDYRLNLTGFVFAIMGFFLESVSKTIPKIGPQFEKGGSHTWDCPLNMYLLIGIPPLLITGYAASKLENTNLAFQIATSWSVLGTLKNLAPAVLLQLIFNSSINSAYPFSSKEQIGGALDGGSYQATTAIATTLQTGFWITCIGVFGEKNLINWFQVLAFTFVYVVCVGPKHIGYYPPRVLNLVSRLFRRTPQPIHAEPWQFPFFLCSTTVIFSILVSSNLMYWSDTVGYNRNLKTWIGPNVITADSLYRPPRSPQLELVIAHSAGDPVESISELIAAFTSMPEIQRLSPRIKLYTKDPLLNATDFSDFKGSFEGELSPQLLHNTGGVSATFLYHILLSWEYLPIHTLFLTTSSHISTSLTTTRFRDYYISPGFPIPDALPKTGFLNLGEYAACQCGSCYDTVGWSDTFHLIPSMWGAARPQSDQCDSVLLTYGNNFVASAARLRGVKRDVWELLYDALVNEDLGNAWAHDAKKLPKEATGNVKVPWDPQRGLFDQKDSLQRPYLGFTVERLWGILLQCSTPEVAWRCPNMLRGWRVGGEREDCSCLD